ncbi:Ig-like domain-containing protein [Janthinobacterium lividum]|uniref:Ig-like domain-containing protein n=1 Tax=Janthinobacterium lividum TaxID=29581 RepID=A0ABU0XLR2_9BURK|nr:Ig-like domain-containing protein [Janthinobacterium lividum]MDQ4624455.1 Ig-like domain-containing protein [Janthinobacterium lividum]MDQ4673941.1 Ig-like domain-containing protein [Janthinobacterium lividum]MDQ4684671.1 Ig-like domain-containing protein [Janthinobacterium lividum]
MPLARLRHPRHLPATLLAAFLVSLAGCGGGSADTQAGAGCSLHSTAGCGGSPPPTVPPVKPPVTPPVTPPVIPPVTPPEPASLASAVNLVFSSTELASAGLAGSEVSVTALVKDGANLALPNAKISFAADSGILGSVDAVTDKNGQARALLGTGGANSNRSITVTAHVGTRSGKGTVAVTGSSVEVLGPAALLLGQGADLTVTVRDSARKPVAGAAIAYSTGAGNGVRVKDGGAALSNAQGQLVLRLTAGSLGKDAVSVSALGAATTQAYAVAGSDLRLSPAVGQDASGADVLPEIATLACQPIDARYDKAGVAQAGSASLSTSRGSLFSDSACSQALPASLIFSNGNLPRSYIQSANAGVATITAAVAGGPTAQTRLEFIAPLSPASKLTVQADPAVLRANTATSADNASTSISTIGAVVRDGAVNNLVKNAPVLFSILSDPSGGYLRQAGRVLTGSDGLARAVYVAGPADSGRDGVLIQARIEGAPQAAATALVRLTVARQALSIKLGTGSLLREHSASVLQKDFAVFVSDSAGNAVPGVAITAAAWPSRYAKGSYVWQADKPEFPDTGVWRLALPLYSCANEDVLRNGIFDVAYDRNGNGVLDPGIPLTVSASGLSDALGMATVTVSYPRNYGSWVDVVLTVRGSVSGTEASATAEWPLPTLASDFSVRRVDPPGRLSPYGSGPCDSSD